MLARYVLYPFFIGAALSPIVEASYLGGERTAGEALRIAARVLPALIGAWLLTRLLWTLSVVFCILPAFVVSTFFVVVAPALVIERLGAVAAMRRSIRLVRPMFWRILLISLLAGVIGYFVDNALGTVPQLGGSAGHVDDVAPRWPGSRIVAPSGSWSGCLPCSSATVTSIWPRWSACPPWSNAQIRLIHDQRD